LDKPTVDEANTITTKKRTVTAKPEKIVLHGIIVTGDVKKILINNSLPDVSNKSTLIC